MEFKRLLEIKNINTKNIDNIKNIDTSMYEYK